MSSNSGSVASMEEGPSRLINASVLPRTATVSPASSTVVETGEKISPLRRMRSTKRRAPDTDLSASAMVFPATCPFGGMVYARKLIGCHAEDTPSLVCLMPKASSTFFDSARRSIPRSFGPKLLHTRITPRVPKM